MAIIEIAPDKSQGSKGIEKTIDKASEKMVLNILQATMYSYPIESCVRESASNMVDAVDEKIIARNILTGIKQVSDYFVERTGEEYQDSKFKADYYDLNWLDTQDKCHITYTEVDGIGFCDTISFHDTGVGLSPERFLKAVGLAYSTKRNTNKVRGGYGCGMKSPLATECDYFTIESCYNGKKIVANCYKYKTDFITPKMNMDTGTMNKSVEVEVGENTYILYYEETTSKNYTKITVPCKKVNRSKFKQAVETQLMYIPQITFSIIDEDKDVESINFKANVEYNSKNIIISNNRYYSRPHIIVVKSEDDVDGICYGDVDFRELELEQLYTPVGIKCLIRSVIQNPDGSETVVQEGIATNPSREKVIFNEATKKYLLKKFEDVTAEASELVQKELKSTDFIEWLKKANDVIVGAGSNTPLYKMGKLIDKSRVAPKFADTSIRFKQNPSLLFADNGIIVRNNHKRFDHATKKDKIERTELTDWSYFNHFNIYWQEGETSTVKDMYLTMTVDGGRFITIKEQDFDKFLESIQPKKPDAVSAEEFFELSKKHEDKVLKLRNEIITALKASKLIKSYDEVEVPDDWKAKLESQDQKITEDGNIITLTPAEKRKLENKIVVQTLKLNQRLNSYLSNDNDTYFTFSKKEPKAIDFMSEPSVYYSTDDDKDLLHLASCILAPQFDLNDSHYGYRDYYQVNNSDITLVKVSNEVERKYCKQHNKINKLFYDLKTDGTMVASSYISNWYTANLLQKEWDKFKFLSNSNYNIINSEIYELYTELDIFRGKYGDGSTEPNYHDKTAYKNKIKEVNSYLDKIKDLQLFVVDHKDNKEAIADKAKELFSTDMITDGQVINMDIYNKFQVLLQYAESIYPLFNEIRCLCKESTTLDSDVERSIREFLELKGLADFKVPVNMLKQPVTTPEEVVEEVEI